MTKTILIGRVVLWDLEVHLDDEVLITFLSCMWTGSNAKKTFAATDPSSDGFSPVTLCISISL